MPLKTVLTSVLLLAASCHLAAREFVLDDDRSFIRFTVDATGHQVDGHVITFDASIDFRPDGGFPTAASVRFASRMLTTEHEERDLEMFRWLEVEKHPEVVFELDSLEGSGSTRIARGSLTLHGVTRGIDVPVTLSSVGPVLTLTGEAEINTHDFRLPRIRRALVMTVAREVIVSFTLIGRLE